MKQSNLIYRLYHYSSWLNYIIWLFELNLVMLVINLPLIIVGLVVNLNLPTLPVYMILSQTLIPTLYALIVSLNQANRNNGVIKKFFSTIQSSFFLWIRRTWLFPVVFMTIIFNITFTSKLPELVGLMWLNILLLCVFLTYVINLLIVCAAWKQPFRTSIILTLKLSIAKSWRYNLNFIIILGTFVILSKFPIYMFTFGIAVSMLLATLNFHPVLEYVEALPENKAFKI